MSKQKLEAIRLFRTYNVGDWLGAKIYSDAKGNKCSCGGTFTARTMFRRRKGDVEYPVCDKCALPPEFFRIWASVVTEDGSKKDIFIRHSPLTGDRLTEIEQCLSILDQVESDRVSGNFDVRKYESKKTKDAFLFKNVVPMYLDFHKKRLERGEISPYGYESKVKYSKFLIDENNKYAFANKDVAKIKVHHIEDYKNSFTDKFSNRDMSLGELKTILNFALQKELINRVPQFEVPSSKKRKEVPDLKVTRDLVIPAIKNPIHREAIRMLDDYGLRPCEVRAIQYEQIDILHDRIKIDRHFSKRTLLPGRKSNKESVLDRPLTKELKAFIKSRPWGLPKAYLFPTTTGTAMGPADLSEAWREAEKLVGVKHVEMYGVRGARITEVLEKDGLTKAKNFAGHSSAITTANRYDHSSTNVDDVIG